MDYLAYFAAGLLLTNGVPHFINGVSGNKFQSPFASPPGVGKSSPMVNVIWGMVNFLIGYMLIMGVGDFTGGLSYDALMLGLGLGLMAVILSWYFGRIHNQEIKKKVIKQ